MEIILLTEISKLGGVGDIVKTREGYARNYLIPYGLAKPATPENCAEVEKRKQELQAEVDKAFAVAQGRHQVLDGMTIAFEAETKDGTELYGSIGVAEVVKHINEESGNEVQKHEVIINDGAIRRVGEYVAVVRLHPDLVAHITVKVTAKGGEAAEAADAGAATSEAASEAQTDTQTDEAQTDETAEATASDGDAPNTPKED